MNTKFVVGVSYIFLIIFAVLCVTPALSYSEDEAKNTIETAEVEVLQCYEAVSKAEKAGANISELLNVLNEASWLLSKAKLAYKEENYSAAVDFANQCRAKLNYSELLNRAENLRANADLVGYWDFMINFVGSAVGAVAILICGFVLWSFPKKREEVRGNGQI